MTLPLSAPGIVAGMLLTFIPAVGDYVNAYFLGGPNQAMIGNVIQGQYLQLANYPIAAALSFVLMALIMVAVVDLPLARRRRGADGRRGRGAHRGVRAMRLGRASAGARLIRERGAYAALAVAYMLIPIAVIVPFSFNDPAGNFNIAWQGFTLDYWREPSPPGAERRDADQPELATLSTIVATAIGTMLALALVRHRVPRPAGGEPPDRAPDGQPEVVIGAALLSMFVYIDVARGSRPCDRARHVLDQLRGRRRPVAPDRLRPGLEEAARRPRRRPAGPLPDGHAAAVRTRVVAAAALAFALSIDDFVVSNFNSGTTVTFPLYIFGASQRGIPVR